jgi:hypothetical protein
MKDWRLNALPNLVIYLLAAALLGLFVRLAIFWFGFLVSSCFNKQDIFSCRFWFCGLILARLTTYTYDVDRQLDRARYLSRARFTSKINHVTDR